LAVTRASGPFFMFCAPGLVFGGNEGVGSRFHVLRARTRFQVPRASRPFLMFRPLGLVFGGNDGVGPCFHVLRARTYFRVPRASGPFFMIRPPGLVTEGTRPSGPFSGTEVVGSRFHVLHARTRFRPYRGCRVPFLCFARPDSFSAVPIASTPIFILCTPGLIFGGTEGVRCYFNVLRARTRFQRYRGRRVSFSCFALPDSFSAVTRASGPIFIFCAPGLIFDRTEGVGSCFHVLHGRTHFSAVPRASGPVF
jgi:hypothetical protein